MLSIQHSAFAILLLLLSSSVTYQTPIQPSPCEIQSSYGDALEAILSIAIRLQVLLEDPDVPTSKNFMISPLSVALIIGQLMIGSEGKFRKELYNLLSLPDGTEEHQTIRYQNTRRTYSLPYSRLHLQLGNLARVLEGKKMSKSFILNTSNALFSNANLKLKEQFVHNLEIYDTDVQAVNFTTDPVGAMQKINEWAALHTNGIIHKVLDSPLPTTAAAVFTNAIYFKADWETPFSYEANLKGVFKSSKEKDVEVEYMRGFFENIPYAESSKLGCKILAFPYKNRDLAMYFILPKVNNGTEYNIKAFAESLKAKDVLELVSQMKNSSVAIQIPKMKLSNSLSVLKPLQRYYAYENEKRNDTNSTGDALDILEERVDEFTSSNITASSDIILTGAAENRQFKVANILQQMTLSVDEKGTEAAAVSLSDMYYIGTKSFRVDRPFIFFIRHELTSATLFWGTITDPSISEE